MFLVNQNILKIFKLNKIDFYYFFLNVIIENYKY